MKKTLILFLFLLPFTLAAKPAFQFSVSKTDSFGLLRVQNTSSTMYISSLGAEAELNFKNHYKAFAFGNLDYQSEIICRNRFSKIGNVPGFSFGLGFGYFHNRLGANLEAGLKAFSEGTSSRNYYALILINLTLWGRIYSGDLFNLDFRLPVEFAFSSLGSEFSTGFCLSLSHSFEKRTK